jgi:hypothetical protein
LIERVDVERLHGVIRIFMDPVGAAGVVDWVEAHAPGFLHISYGAMGLGAFCLALNIWRALRFAMPMIRGLRLLELDARASRVEIDGEIARQSNVIAQMRR